MKKFKITLGVYTRQFVDYEVEAESREKLDDLLWENSIADIGKCVDETAPELYEEEIGDIVEVENDK